MVEYLSNYIPLVTTTVFPLKTATSITTPVKASIVEIVSENATLFCTEEELLVRLTEIDTYFKEYSFNGEIPELYDITFNLFKDYSKESAGIESIGEWLRNNTNDYFAEATTIKEPYTETVRVAKRNGFGLSYEDKEVTRYRLKIVGINLTQDVPFVGFGIEAIPKFENISWHACRILFVFSKSSISFFYYYATYKEKNWKTRYLPSSVKWKTVETALKNFDDVKITLQKIIDEFNVFIMDSIKTLHPPVKDIE